MNEKSMTYYEEAAKMSPEKLDELKARMEEKMNQIEREHRRKYPNRDSHGHILDDEGNINWGATKTKDLRKSHPKPYGSGKYRHRPTNVQPKKKKRKK